MNKVILMGNITRDPEIRYKNKEDGTQICIATTSIAVRRNVARNAGSETQNADFINLTAFGKRAEFFEKYVQKGTALCIEGRINTGSYTNKEGKKVYTFDVAVDEVEFAGSKSKSSESHAPVEKTDSDGFMNIPDGIDDALPFN